MPFTKENVSVSYNSFWKSLFLPVLTGHYCRTIPECPHSRWSRNSLFLYLPPVRLIPKSSYNFISLSNRLPMVHDSLCILLSILNNVFLGSKNSSGFQPKNTFFCVEDNFAVSIERSSYMTDQFKFSLSRSVQTSHWSSAMTITMLVPWSSEHVKAPSATCMHIGVTGCFCMDTGKNMIQTQGMCFCVLLNPNIAKMSALDTGFDFCYL